MKRLCDRKASHARRGRARQWGGELVEFSISLPVILLMLFGIVELSVGFFDQAILTQASRAAAREAVRAAPPSGDPSAWDPEADALQAAQQAAQRMFSWSGPQSLTITVTPDPSTAAEGTPVSVTLSYPYQLLVLPRFMQGALGNLNLSAVTIMRELRPDP